MQRRGSRNNQASVRNEAIRVTPQALQNQLNKKSFTKPSHSSGCSSNAPQQVPLLSKRSSLSMINPYLLLNNGIRTLWKRSMKFRRHLKARCFHRCLIQPNTLARERAFNNIEKPHCISSSRLQTLEGAYDLFCAPSKRLVG